MPNIRRLDMMLIDDLFGMGSGYVLNFSDKTFAIFFAEELNIDIDDPAYAKEGTSKAKRLRYFLQSVDMALAVRTLKVLWEYRLAAQQRFNQPEQMQNAEGRFLDLIRRLGSPEQPQRAPHQTVHPASPLALLEPFKSELLALATRAPHERGFAFETFLKRLFDASGLQARQAFRLVGEQIDGSFVLSDETYLLEAKWQRTPCGVADLHAFHGKLEQKAAWARGLFISDSGFTPEGLEAFGRGKRVICMDGLDLYETLNRQLPLDEVLRRKVRAAAESGAFFVRVSDLFQN